MAQSPRVNKIALAQDYLPILDEIYKRGALTSALDSQNIRFLNANTIQLFVTEMDGLANYDRNNGFEKGIVTGIWEPMKLTIDRGRSFSVDAMDNEESINQAFGSLVGEFMRTKVVPELDAYRFAKMAESAKLVATPADFGQSAHDVAGAIDTAEEVMNDAEVPDEGRILYISENAYKWLKGDIVREFQNESDIRHMVETYDGMRVVRVPKNRFSTAITLNTEEAGGYTPTPTSGHPINFMIVHPSAVVSVVKHAVPRIFDPNTNQGADAWKFDYRIYHDLFVKAAKIPGIYLHAAATPNPGE